VKRRNRSTRILFCVFGYEVRVIFSRDLVASGRRLGEKDDLTEAGAASITLDAHPRVGWLLFGPKPSADNIAHEAAHAIFGLAKASGTTFDEETFCYHLGHLVGHIHEFLRRS
jgi:hypothetical protein